jgi:DNA modification methylase
MHVVQGAVMRSLLVQGNALQIPLASGSVHCVVTSPPYWSLRDYGVAGQLGLEPLHDCLGWATGHNCGACYVCVMRQVFAEVWRVLRDDGTCWLNLGDSYYGGKGQSSQAWSTEHQDRDTLQKAQHQITGLGQTRPNDAPIDGLKPKDLVGIPWRVALALQADGWYLRSDCIWAKPNPMPESVTDRPTKAHEYLFLLSKSQRYYYDADAVRENITQSTLARLSQDIDNQTGSARGNGGAKTNGNMKAVASKAYSFARDVNEEPPPGQRSQHREGREDVRYSGNRNRRTVWNVATAPYSGAHFATYPPALVEPCIKAGCPAGGIVFDPFTGSGTTGLVSEQLGRRFIGMDLSSEYLQLAQARIGHDDWNAWVNGKPAATADLGPLFAADRAGSGGVDSGDDD